MCVIYACYESLPDRKSLEDGYSSNKDGAGVAWYSVAEKTFRFQKGLSDVDDVERVLKDEVKGQLPAIIHFRFGTVGETLPQLTHPFPINEDADLNLTGKAPELLFHNGGWTEWQHVLKEIAYRQIHKVPLGPWSDSRAIAYAAYHLGPGFLSTIASVGRLAYLFTCKGKPYVYRYGSWSEEKGWWQSSKTWARRVDWDNDDWNKNYYSPKGDKTTHLLGSGKESEHSSGDEDDQLNVNYFSEEELEAITREVLKLSALRAKERAA